MQSRGEDAALLEDTDWTLDLAFLTDITGKRNSLNWELQGKGGAERQRFCIRTKSKIRGRESVGESKCPEARGNPSEEGEEEEGLGRLQRSRGRRWRMLGVAGKRRETQRGAGEPGEMLGRRVVWADWVQLEERAQVVVVELIAQEEVGPE
ncbi:hypothetical protein D4764_02G0012410 [Takifugu flavidus]|uniref:Uncharacterized protein n=1 Tax=Takifugu flavidus TaxID=433684 RepID=A0A5C6NQ03_9TELE|nr:hypothetical protein D4764_02G0012410 [Takifugu flavidus]